MLSRRRSVVYREIEKIRVLGFPLGPAVIGLSSLSEDPRTVQSVSQIRDITKESGLVVLDAHRSEWDIMTVAAQLGLHLPDLTNMTGAMAAKWARSFLGKKLFLSINRQPHLNLPLVYRREDQKYVSPEDWGNKRLTNTEFISQTREIISQPDSLAVIAAYGSRRASLESANLRIGAIQLARDFPSICSLATFDWFHFKYLIRLSQVISFGPSASDEHIRDVLQQQFKQLGSSGH